ncbi:MAG: hypothetical protein J5997_02205 [Oscillospiraceae bacterium]|nr:hypothetical protein [Oscillospiraceae bacterium]
MSLFDNESKQRRNKQIKLQNIILDIDEKKLQVSEEFLEKMTKIYISRYLKVINENISSINKVTNISLLFKKYDTILKNIDELIKIEDLHRFRRPTPSEYKEMIEERLDKFIMSLISREWRKIAPQNSAETTDPNLERKWKAFFASFEPYEERLTDNAKNTLEQLKNGVFPPEPPEEEQDDLHLVSEDEFVPETFENAEAPQTEKNEENAAAAENK